MSWRSRLALLTVVVTAAGCGIRPDAEPRTIAGAEPVVGPEAGSESAAAGADRIYLIGPGEERKLRSVAREAAGSTENLIEILLDGPNEAELEAQWTSLIPAGTRLLSSNRQGSILFLDLTAELMTLPTTAQPQALAQIVYTAAEVDGVDAVQITINGEPQQLPKADGQSTNGILRTYDYPGYVESAQPDYPELPSS